MAERIDRDFWTPKKIAKQYSSEPTPLVSYAVLVGAYHLVLYGILRYSSKLDESRKLGLGDFMLLIPATHKLSRIITNDWVTSPFRAPFTEYKGSAGGGEVTEKVRGSGMQKAVGDLLTCQYCIGPWVAAGLVFGFITKTRETRLLASIFALVAGSDFLHFLYQAARARQKQIVQSASEMTH